MLLHHLNFDILPPGCLHVNLVFLYVEMVVRRGQGRKGGGGVSSDDFAPKGVN